MNYAELKKLDEETSQNIKEGTGPADECICSLLAPGSDGKKGIRASIRKALGALSGGVNSKKQKYTFGGQKGNTVDIPLTFTKGGKGLYSTKETVKRTSACGKCGCDDQNIVLKETYANIRISAPDISSICSCPSNCLPNADQLNNNIKVTIEQFAVNEQRTIDDEESQSVSQDSHADDGSTDMSTIPEVDGDDSLKSSSVHSNRTLT